MQLGSLRNWRPCACSVRTTKQSHRKLLTKKPARCTIRANGDSNQGEKPKGPSIADPVQTIAWGGRLPSTRRLILSGLTATGVVLGGNLGGITSRLLALGDGQLARQLQLDTLFPVSSSAAVGGPYKRCIDGRYGYGLPVNMELDLTSLQLRHCSKLTPNLLAAAAEFTYPADWLADQTIAYRRARREEQARGLVSEMPPLTPPRPSLLNAPVVEPVAAYGPPGSSGEENVSVIVAPIEEGFSLPSLGNPQQFAQTFLDMIMPVGVPVEATLLNASSRQDAAGNLYYMMEYTVKRGTQLNRHNLSVVVVGSTPRGSQLFTFNVQVPQALWQRDEGAAHASAASFQLTTSRLNSTGYPGRGSWNPTQA